MFKGTLIENDNYYKLKSKQTLYIMLPSIAIGLLVNFYQMPIWVTIGAIIFYIGIMILTSKNIKKMVKIANKKIEINSNQIVLKEKNGTLIETIKLNSGAILKLKDTYKIPQETITELKEEIIGNVEKHYIIVNQKNIERRFDFEISSYYMLNQLKKVVQEWQKEDYSIEYMK
jgi:hypothetical protein